MNHTYLLIINVFASLFILYIIFQFIRVRSAMKKCEPVHKKIFRVKGTGKWWKTRIFTAVLILFFALVIISLLSYNLTSLVWLYTSTLVGYTMFPSIFRYGKIGRKGVSVADSFIPWEKVESCAYKQLPTTHFFYPNGELTLTTRFQQQYIIIVNNNEEKPIFELLTKYKLASSITTQK
ncbi:hypothetical protein [Heyndrickxia camelliae]|uniref:DUF5673 domain-containing protein n=1 Tax=Heyndrickxia camelliae TaxID=1707093 RepID=A0A2N3LLJ7_9BACI|nr:hypothetical protein [Heyndrickxia camelliae]PKR85424.1 hypothetical protein CWO92_09580 [Heyndrickxia camelliae]